MGPIGQFFQGKKIISLIITTIIILLIWLGHHFLTRKVGRYLYLHGEGVCEVANGKVHYMLNRHNHTIPVSSNGMYPLPLSIRKVYLQLNLNTEHANVYHPDCSAIMLEDHFITHVTFTNPNAEKKTCDCFIAEVEKK